jgi:hypothetical protein
MMRSKLLLLAVTVGVALPLTRGSAAVSTSDWPPQPLPGVPVTVVYPSVAVDTKLYHFVGDDHRHIQIWKMDTYVYRFVDTDHRHIEVAALN